ncbi:hypothetical protein FOA43_004077 [Brettanomyces nanus]|uniref:Uncharacterized protein n=1 Tax=Eeniella nana TaxID=13502 RepID=A0A875S6X0_EENNA|nr:uncharacterized protein FOA43_004077 [Brettanomyces nanus]QPG76683.1 hypothetical protein FOA43_004077 [Brettanomyces nanus]
MTQETADAAVQISVSSSSHKRSDTILASFMNGIHVPESTNFELYQHKKRKLNDVILHGENDTLVYNGSLQNGEDLPEGDGDYCLGIFDPIHRSLKLVKTKLIPSRTQSKKSLKAKENYQDISKLTYNDKRNRLGEEFGTSRAKKALNSFKKNRVDATKLAENELDIAESIQKTTVNIPDRAQLTDMMEEQNRLIPPYNKDALNVEDVYPLEGIISSKELNVIRVDSLLSGIQDGTDAKKLLETLPYFPEDSNYLLGRLLSIAKDDVNAKLKLQMLYYLSVLLAIFTYRKQKIVVKLSESFNNQPPTLLLETCLSKFSDYDGYRKSFYIDPMNEDRLISYMLVLMLKLDDYSVAISPLAHELSLKPSRLSSLLRSLGCVNKMATFDQREVLGVPKSSKGFKVSLLKVPFKLPSMAVRQRKQTSGNKH